MKLTPGKLAGLKKVSNERGVIAAAAMDQRGSLQKSLAKEKGAFPKFDAAGYLAAGTFASRLPAALQQAIRANGIRNR